MNKNNGMVGFWAIVSIAVMAVGCILSMAYFNPPKSLLGLLITLVIMLFWLGVANLIINFLYLHKEEDNQKTKDGLGIYASSEAMNEKDRLQSEFSKLVSRIAWYNAGLEKESEIEEKILISPEDMEKAFLEAAKLVTEKCALDRCPCKTNCDKQTVLQRIQNIRKNFEEKSQTP